MNSMFFSKSTNGFYAEEIHGSNMPDDVVEITAEEHGALLEGQSSGKQISSNENGYPILIDPPAPTPEQQAKSVRNQRDSLLRETDHLMMPDYPISAEMKASVESYRQSLRDITEQSGFPDNVVWPVKPEGV